MAYIALGWCLCLVVWATSAGTKRVADVWHHEAVLLKWLLPTQSRSWRWRGAEREGNHARYEAIAN